MRDSSNYKQRGFVSKNQSGSNRRDNFMPTDKTDLVQDWIVKNPFSKDWIEKETDSDMVKYTEEAGRFMANNGLTNSKIRSIYGEIKRIQMGKYNEEKAAFILLRPKVAYAHGRDNDNKGLTLFKRIFDNAANHVRDQKSFNNFCNFFEAILAYHKAFGGKD